MEHFKLYDEALIKFGANQVDDLNYLLQSIERHNLNIDQILVKKAFVLCCEVHKTEKRASGVPYYTHPLSVALILIEELHIDLTSIIVAALLHSVWRKPNIDIKYIRKEFGANVAVLLVRFSHIIKHTKTSQTTPEVLHLMFTLIIKDVRVFILQLCNRLHDIRTLEYVSETSQKFTALETLNFYIPFAHKFGFTKMQHELESRAFYFYNRVQYEKNIDFLKIQKKLYSEYIFILMENIKQLLSNYNISHTIKILHKQEYELFLQLSEIQTCVEDNIFSLCIVLDIEELDNSYACRRILDLIVSHIKHNEAINVFSAPLVEIDGSVSLELYMHNKKIRINVKTKEIIDTENSKFLKNITDINVKYTDTQLSDNDIRLWSAWMKKIIKSHSATKAEKLIWNSLKVNLYDDKIIVYDLHSKKIILPKESTALDFAFNISEQTGLQAITCRINGAVKGLFTKLTMNDIVEIITSPQCKPDSSWLNHVVTFKSEAYLTKHFRSKYKLNGKSNIIIKELYQKFLITCKTHDNIISLAKNIIGLQRIYRIKLSNNMINYVISIQTDIEAGTNTNDIFLQLLQLKGVIGINVSYQTW